MIKKIFYLCLLSATMPMALENNTTGDEGHRPGSKTDALPPLDANFLEAIWPMNEPWCELTFPAENQWEKEPNGWKKKNSNFIAFSYISPSNQYALSFELGLDHHLLQLINSCLNGYSRCSSHFEPRIIIERGKIQ